MKIKILKSCSGYHFSFKQDDVVDVEDYIGSDLIQCGFAENCTEVFTENFTEKPTRKRGVKKNADT